MLCDFRRFDESKFFILHGGVGKPTTSAVLKKVEGALAQLVEHLHGMQRVSGSNPLRSTIFR